MSPSELSILIITVFSVIVMVVQIYINNPKIVISLKVIRLNRRRD